MTVSKHSTRFGFGSTGRPFALAFSLAFKIKHDLERTPYLIVSLGLTTDSFLFVLRKSGFTLEKPLLNESKTGRDAYKCYKLDNIAVVKPGHINADALIPAKNSLPLMKAIKKAQILTFWISGSTDL